MTNPHPSASQYDQIASQLGPADYRVLLNDWLPPQARVAPKFGIGRYRVNVLWFLPLGFGLAVIGVIGVPPTAWPSSTAFRRGRGCRTFLTDLEASSGAITKIMSSTVIGCLSNHRDASINCQARTS